jgi:hypothetical protein
MSRALRAHRKAPYKTDSLWKLLKVEERLQVGPEAGPTSAFHNCIPTELHGPTWIFWANLTTFLPIKAGPDRSRLAPRAGAC